jgi:hypothetical protein
MGDGEDHLHDHELADACLCLSYVAGTELIGTGETRLSRCFVEGPEVFPRPTGLHAEGSPGLFIALEFRLRRMSCGVHEETANGYEGTASWS